MKIYKKRGMNMEYEKNDFSSNGKGNLAVTLGAIGTGLGVLSGGLGNLGGVFGNNTGCNEDHYVNRYELALQKEIEAKNSRIALLESNIYVDSKIADVYERLNTKIGCVENQLAQQAVYNATLNGTVSCIQGQIATLQALTKTIIPIANICPQPAVATTGA
jgi:hypothetical protein